MRNVSKGLVSLALTGFAVGVIAACSADGSTDIPGDMSGNNTGMSQDNTDPGTDTSNPTGSSNNGNTGTDTGKDAGKSGGGSKSDAGSMGVDAGPPAPNPGDPCKTANEVFTRSCGFCGSQQALCLANGDGGPGGTVQEYSSCTGEVADGCMPGDKQMEACGLCGTHQKICQNNCQWAAGTCTGEPANACQPGTVLNSGASCSAGSYRQATCGTDCKLGNYSGTCGPFVNPHTIAISGTAKGVVSLTLDMEASATAFAIDSFATCPDTDTMDIITTAAADYVEVDNNTGKAASVTVYTSPTNVGDQLSTSVWTYSGAVPPATDNAKIACQFGVSAYCDTDPVNSKNTTLCGPDSQNFYFSALGHVTIPVGGKILVYTGSDTDSGKVQMNIRTDTLN